LIVIGEDMVNTAYDSAIDQPPSAQIERITAMMAQLADTDPTELRPHTLPADVFADVPVPEREWHLRDMVPASDITLFYGDGGTGKSLLALQMAVAAAAGIPWLGRDTRHGPAFYLSAEDDVDELHRRLSAICADAGVGMHRLADLHIRSVAGTSAVLAAFDKLSTIAPTAGWRELVSEVERLRPILVVLDTLGNLFAGNEIDKSHASQFINLVRGLALRYRCAVLLLAHPSLSGMSSGSGTAGSVAWSNATRSRLYLDRVREGGVEVDPDERILTTKKSNYGPVGDTIRLRWSRGVFIVTDDTPSETVANAHRRAEDVFKTLLAEYGRTGRHVSANRSRTWAPSVFAGEQMGRAIGQKALDEAMGRLILRGDVIIETHGPPSRPRSHLALP